MQADQTPPPRRALHGEPDASGGSSAPKPHPGRPAKSRRRLKVVLASLLALLLVGFVAGLAYYRHLNQNLTSIDLPSDVQVTGGTGGATASASPTSISGLPAGVAQNIVVIGTDSRESEEDCRIGGACGKAKLDGDTNADVEILVHIAADHQSMSVLSIPRDTVIDLPECTGNGKTRKAGRGQINQTLNYGIDCTLRSIHQLSGLPITHFAMVDFSGVISLSEAIGGVDVCVDNNVYDPYSHLKLAKGEHSLEGMAALQFLRTRHGFGDGSDLGRTVAQHLFLSSLQRQLESKGTLLNPSRVHRLAEAATNALTVDKGLANVSTLAQVATTVGRIPASATSFVTLPTAPDPNDSNRVVPAKSAQALFDKLAKDEPLATAKPSPSASPSSSSPSGASSSASTPKPSTSSSSSKGSASASSTATETANVSRDGVPQVSSEVKGCAPVSQQKTVQINKVNMTPIEAFDKSPSVPLSAP